MNKITLEFTKDGKFYFVECKDLLLVGNGLDMEDALDDFAQHFRHFRQHYAKLPLDKRASHAARLWRSFAEFDSCDV